MVKYQEVGNPNWDQLAVGSSRAHKGKALTDQHKERIAMGLRERADGQRYVIQAINANDPTQVLYFDTGAEAAEELGCSRQLISQCLRREARNNHQFSARGWILSKITLEDEL